MLPWWGWMLLWLCLLAGSALLLWVRVRSVWRRAGRLLTELDRAGRALDEATSFASAPVREEWEPGRRAQRGGPGEADPRDVH